METKKINSVNKREENPCREKVIFFLKNLRYNKSYSSLPPSSDLDNDLTLEANESISTRPRCPMETRISGSFADLTEKGDGVRPRRYVSIYDATTFHILVSACDDRPRFFARRNSLNGIDCMNGIYRVRIMAQRNDISCRKVELKNEARRIFVRCCLNDYVSKLEKREDVDIRKYSLIRLQND